MKLLLIGVAFDSGHRDQRMGRGPGRLIDGGAVERLRQGGHDVEVAFAEPASRFTTEIGTAFELQRSVAAYVGRARAANAFPLILSGELQYSSDRRPGWPWRQPAIARLVRRSRGLLHA